jgi:hypothetical protein
MRWRNVLVLLLANAPTLLLAAGACEQESGTARSDPQQYYMILAAQTDVFYDRSGPTFVMLQRTAADEADVGAFGIYAGERRQPVFGPVPASIYERFVSETRKPADVLLRLSISKPQYDRALAVMQSWERRGATPRGTSGLKNELWSNHHVANSKTRRGEWYHRHYLPDPWSVSFQPQCQGRRVPESRRQVPGR